MYSLNPLPRVLVTVTPYEALVQSASRLTDADAFGDIDDGDVSAASGLLERNRAALESARCALSQRCAVGGGEFGGWPSVAAGCADLCLDANDYL